MVVSRLCLAAGVFLFLGLLSSALVVAENNQTKDDPPKQDTPKTEADGSADFLLEKDELSTTGSNPYFILEPGYVLVLVKGNGRALEKHTITVLNETKKVGDFEVRVIEEKETKGGKPVETSRNYFAISKITKNVYYFGEDVDIYKQGKVDNHEGSWLHGVNGARFGLMMPGTVNIKAKYYHEQAPKVAMDRAEIVSVGETVVTPAGTFQDCIKVEETTPLEPESKNYKYYAPGVGLVQDGDLKLTRYGKEKNEQLLIPQGNNDPLAKSNADLLAMLKEEQNVRINAEQKLKEATARLEAKKMERDEKIADLQVTITGLQVNLEKQRLDYSRILEENKQMLQILQDREKRNVDLQADLTTAKRDLQTNYNQIAALENRLKNVTDQMQKLEQRLAKDEKRDAGVPNDKRDSNQLNPPPIHVKGVIAKIDPKDKNFVQLNVGTGHGVNRNHTLEVYRLKPRPLYLGIVRIIDSYPQSSVGRLMRTPSSPIIVGNIVESPISP